MKAIPNTQSRAPGKVAAYKRWLDLTILIVAHVALAPIWLLLWTLIPALIWLEDRGPVFYGQTRMGKDGKPFALLKFRTMVVDADRIGPRWNVNGDPRVTRVGKFLRRTAMDELPGLLAIWKGDMSLVGPRALDAKEHAWLETQIPGFVGRLRVAPGLTGLSQVYNHDDEAPAKLRYDLFYIQKMNLMLDLKLIFLSVINTLSARWDQRGGKPPVTTGPVANEYAAGAAYNGNGAHSGALTREPILTDKPSPVGAGEGRG